MEQRPVPARTAGDTPAGAPPRPVRATTQLRPRRARTPVAGELPVDRPGVDPGAYAHGSSSRSGAPIVPPPRAYGVPAPGLPFIVDDGPPPGAYGIPAAPVAGAGPTRCVGTGAVVCRPLEKPRCVGTRTGQAARSVRLVAVPE